MVHGTTGWEDSKKDWIDIIGNLYFIASITIKRASMCIDLLFSTPREVYVNESHALFVRQSLILTAGIVIEIMISYYLNT